jgi:eukaryotic-like serine/threonine-protein kinase
LNLDDLVRIDGPQRPDRIRHILRQVAGSLAEAHGVGLIHRDIKPGNVILVPERGGAVDVAKVVDFGLVKDLDRETRVSGDHPIAGTPLYLSPEAITSPERTDARSDLYSLACLGYFLLTGHPVFEGATVIEVCGRHLHAQPTPPAERLGRPVPEKLSALLLSCLEKNPDLRPASARAFISALDACDDVQPWTDDQARDWWESEGRRILAGASARERSTEAGLTSIIRPVDTAVPHAVDLR